MAPPQPSTRAETRIGQVPGSARLELDGWRMRFAVRDEGREVGRTERSQE